MKVLLFFVVMVAMMAVLMAQEGPESVKCSRGESFLCFLKCITQAKVPESCGKVNGTVNCVCRAINATRPE